MNLTDEQIFELLPFKPEIGKKYYFFSRTSLNVDLISRSLTCLRISRTENKIEVVLEFGDVMTVSYQRVQFSLFEKDKKIESEVFNEGFNEGLCHFNEGLCNIAFETKEAAISFLTKKLTESEVEEL
jgi:hypothetical protein